MKTTEAKKLNKKNKMNTYLKYGLLLLAGFIAGGILGGMMVSSENMLERIIEAFEEINSFIGHWFWVFMIAFAIISIAVGELGLAKMKSLIKNMEAAENEDEEEKADLLDYQLEKITAVGMAVMNVANVLSMILVAVSTPLVKADKVDDLVLFFAGLGIYLLLNVYVGIWNIRVVKLCQKNDPSKKGDPVSSRFAEEWEKSCDEGEQEIIRKAAFKSYTVLQNLMPMITLVAVLMHWAFNTGIFAVVVAGAITLIQVFTYLIACVKLKKQNLEA